MKVVLRDKGRVTIPSYIRRRLGLKPGDELQIELKGNMIILRPKYRIRLDDIVGVLGKHEVNLDNVEEALGRE